jgi:hypothetical protein
MSETELRDEQPIRSKLGLPESAPVSEVIERMSAVYFDRPPLEDATELASLRTQLQAEVERREAAENLIRRFREWDHLDNAGDGPYWKRTIDEYFKETNNHVR